MKKQMLLCAGLHIAAAAFSIIFSLIFVKNVSLNEVHTVQNLAGAVLSASPETEPSFVRALKYPSAGQQKAGARLLARYGYEETSLSDKNTFYRKSLRVFIGIFIIFSVTSLSLSCRSVYLVRRQQKTQEALLSSFLERCLSDDYGFLDRPEELAALQSEALSDALSKLLSKLRLKSEALAGEKDNTKTLVTDISHQLKTPLAALGSCFSVYLEADTEEARKEFGERCKFQLTKLENLTASLINISRLESAMILLQPAPVSLADILAGAVDAVYGKAAAKQITIDTENFPDITLSLDRKWTTEALFNILDNAVKYSPAGTAVRIRVQILYSFVRVEIEDQGIGVPKEEYNKIFKRFYRGRSEAVQKAEGSGVGLYLSRKILEEQGATLSVKAAGERGSIFVVQLPIGGL